MARALLEFTDGEVRMLGTVRVQLIDKWNKAAVIESVGRLQDSERGNWELIAAVDASSDQEKLRAAYMRAQSKIPKNERLPYSGITTFSPRAGILSLKIKNVIFYTNHISSTPTSRVLD